MPVLIFSHTITSPFDNIMTTTTQYFIHLSRYFQLKTIMNTKSQPPKLCDDCLDHPSCILVIGHIIKPIYGLIQLGSANLCPSAISSIVNIICLLFTDNGAIISKFLSGITTHILQILLYYWIKRRKERNNDKILYDDVEILIIDFDSTAGEWMKKIKLMIVLVTYIMPN